MTKKQAQNAVYEAACAIASRYPSPVLRAAGGRALVPVALLDAAAVAASGYRVVRAGAYVAVPHV